MKPQTIMTLWIAALLFAAAGGASGAEEKSRYFNWLTVSDKTELQRTWSQSLVFLPKRFGRQSIKLLAVPGKLEGVIGASAGDGKMPTVLYLHSCEGLGHHREDLRRLARLGFVVIAPDSFARDYRPYGCYEEAEKFLPSFDLAAAFQKAELDYAVKKLEAFSWIDRKNLFLVGSGMGGMAAAHYAGGAFAGHVIEGWGCRGPNPVFDGIWSSNGVRIFSAVSRNDPWYRKNPGFGVDCASFLKDRPGSVSIVLERPAHYVSWYPKSLGPLVRFLTRDMDVDTEALASDIPPVIQSSPTGIKLREKWSDEAVYAKAVQHCAAYAKTSYLSVETNGGVYEFVCE